MHTNTHPQTVLVWYVETEEQKIHCQAETCCAMPHNFAVQRRDVVSPQSVYLQTHTHTRTEDAQTLNPILTTGNTLRTQSFHSHSTTLSPLAGPPTMLCSSRRVAWLKTGYFYHPSSISCVPTVAQIGTRFKTRPSVRGEHHFSLATCNRGLPQCIAMATRSVRECTVTV